MSPPPVAVAFPLAAGAIGALFAALAWWRPAHPEAPRKAAHVGVGLIAVSFPWLFANVVPVIALSALGVALVLSLRFVPALRARGGHILHGVRRTSIGDLAMPIVIPLLFGLADGSRPEYVVPMLVLTFADGAAAIVGTWIGRWRYRTDEGHKTLEGSIALALVTVLIVGPGALALGADPERALAMALVISVFALLTESICWRGLDNVVLPLATFALLRLYRDMPIDALWWRVGGLALLVVLAAMWHRRARLIGAAGFGAALLIFGAGALGGPAWLAPPLIVFAALPFLGHPGAARPEHDRGAGPVLCLSAAPLACLFLRGHVDDASTFPAFVAGGAAALGVTTVARARLDRAAGVRSRALPVVSVIALGAMIAAALPAAPLTFAHTMAVTAGAYALAVTVSVVAPWEHATWRAETRWMLRGALVALPVLVVALRAPTLPAPPPPTAPATIAPSETTP